MREEIRDDKRNRIGYVETQSNGRTVVYDKTLSRIGEIKKEGQYDIAYDKHGSRIAKWSEKEDITYDRFNHRIGKGNMLVSMFFN